MQSNEVIEEKRPELAIMFDHDSARPRTSLATRQKLFERAKSVRNDATLNRMSGGA